MCQLYFFIFITNPTQSTTKNRHKLLLQRLMSADFYGCLIEIAFLFKFSQRHSFAVFIFDVGVFQLTAEAVAEIGKIFLSQFLLFSLFCFGQAFFSCFFCKKVYSFKSFVHKFSPFNTIFLFWLHNNICYHKCKKHILYTYPCLFAVFAALLPAPIICLHYILPHILQKCKAVNILYTFV